MANAKSRLKAPKSASTKKKKEGRNVKKLLIPKKSLTCPKKTLTGKKKSLTGPTKSDLEKNDIKCDVVMKRPSTRKVMTPDEKVKFVLKNGHKLKDTIFAKPPVNVKQEPQNFEPNSCYKKKHDTNLPLMTKSGHLIKKIKCNMKLIDSILKNELMITDGGNTINTDDAPPLVSPAPVLVPPPLPVGVDNNNDIEITDQNNTFQDFSDCYEYKLSYNISATSDDFSAVKNCLEDSIEKCVKKSSKKKNKPRQTLKNGVVLKLAYFECDNCARTFNSKCSLRRHMYMHLGIKPFNCLHCPQKFMSRYYLKVHVNRYHKSSIDDPELFICNFCEKPFLVRENWEKHLETHKDTENSFKCIYCSEVFSHHVLLMHHEKKHMVKGRHVCTLCSRSYRCRNHLYWHIKSHLKIKDFICQYCGKEFLRPNSLTRHVEINHIGHRIVCPICKKSLKGHLTEHIRTHEKKRPYACPECGKQFTQSTQMNVHRRAHTGDKPYPCRICKRCFSHSNALMLHNRCHTGEKPFPCAMCPMSFSQLPHMKTHMFKIHGKENPYKCFNCDSFYKLKAQLDVHTKICTAGANVDQPVKVKSFEECEEVIEMESPMPLPRMRLLLALLLTMISTKETLKYLGFNKRLIDDILVETLEAMGQTPCKDQSLSPTKLLRKNIEMFIMRTVPKDQMEIFKNENRSIEEILELLTAEKNK